MDGGFEICWILSATRLAWVSTCSDASCTRGIPVAVVLLRAVHLEQVVEDEVDERVEVLLGRLRLLLEEIREPCRLASRRRRRRFALPAWHRGAACHQKLTQPADKFGHAFGRIWVQDLPMRHVPCERSYVTRFLTGSHPGDQTIFCCFPARALRGGSAPACRAWSN